MPINFLELYIIIVKQQSENGLSCRLYTTNNGLHRQAI